ncbi:MAG: NADH-quinone oxidoreductase subunit NuoE [Chloroflexi bacterium]|nr:NADH-quinone oxidoreductase subunit NuoE [Chloroflexota bacterium]
MNALGQGLTKNAFFATLPTWLSKSTESQVPDELAKIAAEYEGEKGALIPVLQKVQGKFGYLSKEAISQIAKFSRMSESEVFGVASFYAQFYFSRRGQHTVKVCLGTACHVRGGERILDEVKRELDVESGGTTKDYKFSLERVACFGSCALAPVVVIDKDVHGRMTVAKAKEILSEY